MQFKSTTKKRVKTLEKIDPKILLIKNYTAMFAA